MQFRWARREIINLSAMGVGVDLHSSAPGYFFFLNASTVKCKCAWKFYDIQIGGISQVTSGNPLTG